MGTEVIDVDGSVDGGQRQVLSSPAPGTGTLPALRGRHLFAYDVVAVSLAVLGAIALRFDSSDLLTTRKRDLLDRIGVQKAIDDTLTASLKEAADQFKQSWT